MNRRMLKLAVRNLGLHPGRSLLSGASIVVAVLVLVFYLAFTDGVTADIIARTTELSTGALQVHRKGFLASDGGELALTMPASDAFSRRLAVEGVTAVSPRIRFEGLLSNGQWAVSVWALAFSPAREYAVCPEKRKVQRPTAFEEGLVVTNELGRSLGASPGTALVLSATSAKGRSDAVWLEVASEMALHVPFVNHRLLWLPLESAQSLLMMPDEVNEYALQVADLGMVEGIAQRLRTDLGAEFEVSTWAQREPMAKQFVDRFARIFVIVTICLVLLAAAGVANTMLMNVSERSKELGTMLAVGMRRRQMIAMITLEALALASLSAILGAALGALAVAHFHDVGIAVASPGQRPALVHPAQSWLWPLFGVFLAELAAVLASIVPALRLSKLSPIEALRER
jgi:putative ABC transport system permease protein